MKLNRPDNFFSLPISLQESLLWEMELDYDSYESSKAETIHSILCGNTSPANEYVIRNFYKALSDETLIRDATNELENAKITVSNLREFLGLEN